MVNKVYMKIKGHVFECLPERTELRQENQDYGRLHNPCLSPSVNSFTAAITTPQPWSCRTQEMWSKLAKKPRTVYLVMVTEDSATEWIFKNVDITFLSDIEDEEFRARGGVRPLMPTLSGQTTTEVKTISHTHAWWQR